MPRYDYRCPGCHAIREESHGMNEAPLVTCACGAKMLKLISRPNLVVHNTMARRVVLDHARRDADMQVELRQGHGIHKFTPLGGNTTQDVYREVKANPGLVAEKMAATRERNEQRTKQKQRDWAVKANRRVARRTIEANEKRAAEAAAKRAVVLSTKI